MGSPSVLKAKSFLYDPQVFIYQTSNGQNEQVKETLRGCDPMPSTGFHS